MVILIVLVITMIVVPLAFMIIGILRRRKENGISLFMTGAGWLTLWLSIDLSGITGVFICRILHSLGIQATFHNTGLLSLGLWVLLLWASYKIYRFFTTLLIKKYMNFATLLINRSGCIDSKDCVKLLLKSLEKNLLAIPKNSLPTNIQRSAEIELYKIAHSLVNSTYYRSAINGCLLKDGESLLFFCQYCIKYFFSQGYINETEYENHIQDLSQCETHLERYMIF